MAHIQTSSCIECSMFHCVKLEIRVPISPCLHRLRDFKFAGTPVQRLQLAMVNVTQFQRIMLSFLMEGHIDFQMKGKLTWTRADPE